MLTDLKTEESKKKKWTAGGEEHCGAIGYQLWNPPGFSGDTVKPEGSGASFPKGRQNKNCPPRIPHLAKSSFKIKDDIRWSQMRRVCCCSPAFVELLRKFIQTELTEYYSKYLNQTKLN